MSAAHEARFEGVVVADVYIVEVDVEGGKLCFCAEEEMAHGGGGAIGADDHASVDNGAVCKRRCDAGAIGTIGNTLKGFVVLPGRRSA